MKKKTSITLDEEVLNTLQRMPRSISISGLINLLLRTAFDDVIAGRRCDNQFYRWLETEKGEGLKECLLRHWNRGNSERAVL